jgi:hypothetical protein
MFAKRPRIMWWSWERLPLGHIFLCVFRCDVLQRVTGFFCAATLNSALRARQPSRSLVAMNECKTTSMSTTMSTVAIIAERPAIHWPIHFTVNAASIRKPRTRIPGPALPMRWTHRTVRNFSIVP